MSGSISREEHERRARRALQVIDEFPFKGQQKKSAHEGIRDHLAAG